MATAANTAFRPDTQLQGITDLTLLAPIKPGFITAFDTLTHVERTRRVLKTLNALRLGSRENSDPPSPFDDVVRRFRIVHSFRWALIENEGQPTQLLLNVCFDGGWDPYMRVIWRDLGSMLDLILCSAEGYPLSCESSFERYMKWVRSKERSSDFLYLASGLSSSDHEYLAALERQQRTDPPKDAQLAAARLRTPSPGATAHLPAPGQPQFAMAVQGLTPMAALYALERYFLPGQPDGECLIRAARDILFEMVSLDTKTQFPSGHPLREAHARMLKWFETAPAPKPVVARRLDYDPAAVQGGMLRGYDGLVCGAMVLLRVTDRAAAVAWLGRQPFTAESRTGPGADGLYRNVALSLAGLRALGVPATRLDRFPQAFKEGMENRAGALGDLRHNHPRWWKLPERNWPAPTGKTVRLGSVHVMIQLRSPAALDEAQWQPLIAALGQGSGLEILSVQPMRRNAPGGVTTENFGFVDGISQPTAEPQQAQHFSDQVERGELLLGYRSNADAYAVPEQADALLDNGSFLVVRKLRQHVGRLHAVLDRQARSGLSKQALMGKLMGRMPDGRPLAAPEIQGNDFSYAQDPVGAQCPFHAHIRRANPREGKLMPRILRRGMSYGPKFNERKPDDEDRGLIFMAYNANLSEQFETLQRWIAGGNSSGGYSGQSDPFLGVAVKGEPRIYRFEHQGKAVSVDLGDEPFVELQWGAYFFVPSLTALRNLPALVELPLPVAPPAPVRAPALDDKAGWQQWLEESNATRDAAWAYVRAQPGGVLRTAYGVLVGEPARVCEVFRNVDRRYSVAGYGDRMHASLGRGFLGMDEDAGHDAQAPAVNALIERISELEAFQYAFAGASKYLSESRAKTTALNAALPADARLRECTVDLERLSETVLAGLCRAWFGLPDGRFMWDENQAPAVNEPPRCPRGFFAVSRFVFGPEPSPVVSKVGADKGQALLKAVTDWLASKPADMPPLVRGLIEAMKPFEAADFGATARTLTGVILGFPPTVHGNLLQTLGAWGVTQKLWDLQLDYLGSAQVDSYSKAVATLRPALLATMMRQPVPFMVWRQIRKPHRLGEVDIAVGDKLIVGITSATAANPGDHFQMFGGDRHDAVQPAPPHACSGYPMAMGTMLGVIAAVLGAGTLRPTPSPTVVNLDL